MKYLKMIRQALSVCAALMLVFVTGYSGLRLLESAVLRSGETVENAGVSKTVFWKGEAYYPRQDITVILLMGIDENGPAEDSGSYNNTGEADLVSLLICDEKQERIHFLTLNRDTMLEIPVLGIEGRQAGTITGQLALAHTYGSGLEDSCENTRKTVSAFLKGIQIDHYIAMNMDAIPILNDAVGGVRVTVTDDFSMLDPGIPTGEHMLTGEQATTYLRSRRDLGDQLNISRMKRHEAYLKALCIALQEKKDETNILSVYEQILPYVVTDCSVNLINNLQYRYGEYTFGEMFTPVGENVLGERYYEFYPDAEQLDALIMELFYATK